MKKLNEKGFFMSEAMIICAFIFLLAGAALMFQNSIRSRELGDARSIALFLAREQLAELEYKAGVGELKEGEDKWFGNAKDLSRDKGLSFDVKSDVRIDDESAEFQNTDYKVFMAKVDVSWTKNGRTGNMTLQRRIAQKNP